MYPAMSPVPYVPAASSTAPGPLPGIQTVEQRTAAEKKSSRRPKTDNLPVLYVDAPKPGDKPKKIQVPTGGARVVFRGQEGQKVTMQRTGPPASQNSNVKVVRAPTRSGAVYSTPQSSQQPQVQVLQTTTTTSGTTSTTMPDQIIIVQQPAPQIVPVPYYGYGYRRYGYGYPYYGYPCYGLGLYDPYFW